jgi:hypothetical protein
MLWTKAERRGKKALTLLVLTLGLTAGSLATSVPTAEARWVRRCRHVRHHYHWVTRCHRVWIRRHHRHRHWHHDD